MTVEEQYASSCENNGWTNPENIVGEADVACAFASNNGERLNALFNFNIPANAIIDDFEVDIKAITSILHTERCWINVWNGVEWIFVADINEHFRTNCLSTVWHGYKSIVDLIDTPEKVNGVKIQFFERVDLGGAGNREQWTSYADAAKCRVTYHVPTAVKPKRMLIGVGL